MCLRLKKVKKFLYSLSIVKFGRYNDGKLKFQLKLVISAVIEFFRLILSSIGLLSISMGDVKLYLSEVKRAENFTHGLCFSKNRL